MGDNLMHAVKLENLRFSYGNLPVFGGLNLEIPKGSFSALVGRNGAGKSTLIKMLAGLVHPTAGSLRVLGRETDVHTAELLASIGYVSESICFHMPHLLEEIFPIYRASYPDWDPVLEKRLMETFRLEKKKSFLEMSRGQRMLFCFVLAACHKPALYLIDEITSVLDPYNRKIVLDHILADVKSGATAVIATNIVAEIHGYADRIVFIEGETHVTADSVAAFCDQFVKFRAPTALEEPLLKSLDATLVGTEGDSLLYVCRKENTAAVRGLSLEIAGARVLPMEAFLYLSRGGKQ